MIDLGLIIDLFLNITDIDTDEGRNKRIHAQSA